jgi:hypothetical protein
MNGLHVAILILALLMALGSAFVATRPDPVSRYGLPLLALALAVFLLDLVFVAARVY